MRKLAWKGASLVIMVYLNKSSKYKLSNAKIKARGELTGYLFGWVASLATDSLVSR